MRRKTKARKRARAQRQALDAQRRRRAQTAAARACVKTTGPVCPRYGPTGNIECHHVPLTLNFVVSGMIMVAEAIGHLPTGGWRT